jgi:hypothetical protein
VQFECQVLYHNYVALKRNSKEQWIKVNQQRPACSREKPLYHRDEWRWVTVVTALIVLLSFMLHIIGWLNSSGGWHFMGIVINVPDGHSYIAKMRQGYEGNWLFRLPYTPEDQRGALLYLLYITLGNVARVLGLPLELVFHIARAVSNALLVVATYALAARLSPSIPIRRLAVLFALFGSGFGWFLIAFDIFLPDLWLPEAFPFQSMLLNVHFPLALALALVVLNLFGFTTDRLPWYRGLLGVAVTGILTMIRSDLTIVILGTVGVAQVLRAWRDRRISWRSVGWIAAAGLVSVAYSLYTLYILATDPSLESWIAQNLQLTPPLVHFGLGYGFITVLAVAGLIVAVSRRDDGDLLLLAWLGILLVAIYLPFDSQRRFSMGMGLALGLLAVRGWEALTHRLSLRRVSMWGWLVGAMAALTNLVLVGSLCQKVLAHDPQYFLTSGEWAAMNWMEKSLPKDAVVLASPDTGIFIPAWAGQRVVYGHPCETIRADERRQQVTAFWSGEMSPEEQVQFLVENRVSFAFLGPRERALGGFLPIEWGELIFESQDTQVYKLNGAAFDAEQR